MNDLSIRHSIDVGEGRNCPLSYRYSPAAIAALSPWSAEVLYVVGGLYGNPFALMALEDLVARESRPVHIVFNGDFNWFNIDDADFQHINTRVLRHLALRGNVETELASATPGAGCGCGYPHWVDAATVRSSNQIMARLAATAGRHGDLSDRLRELPMYMSVQVGDLRVALVHGDGHSLAGWRFALENLADAAALARLRTDFLAAGVQVFASSHTCTPVLRCLSLGPNAGEAVLINNGAAGMPNFAHSQYGVITRIATRPAPLEPLYGKCIGAVRIEALALHYDAQAFQRWFLESWPQDSPAYASYYRRIVNGPQAGPAASTPSLAGS